MKDIYDMGIGESFYLKETVVTISTRTGKACEFDEERIDINDLIIEELKKVKADIKDEEDSTNWLVSADVEKGWNDAIEYAIGKIDNRISELKGE